MGLSAEAAPGVGSSHPLGATLERGVFNFSVYSPHATGLELVLFDDAEQIVPGRVIRLDRHTQRTGDYWHVAVPNLEPGQLYAFRADGPRAGASRLAFDPSRALLDPYGRGVAVPLGYDRLASARGDPTPPLKSVLVDGGGYDWEGDRPLGRAWSDTIIYEAHLRGFTANPNSGIAAARRGTYAGFAEKIPYLVDLGVTAVELLPVFQFDAQAAPGRLTNYWGYQPVSFFAPHVQYATRSDAQTAIDEFRDLVKALHRAGLEVILDVVYNHTAEDGIGGPAFCFRGLANDDYYILGADGSYVDASGVGNTLNASNPIVRRMILDSLRYWVGEMHVDGFRFDLAAILTRDEDGNPDPRAPTPVDIDTDPMLAGTKLIAEAWDAGGLYEVGSFAGHRWMEWNGRFRDDIRSFVKGDPGRVGAVAQRLLASPDIYAAQGREPQQSINFVTCHDGFTLNDLVTYDRKHNEANGEQNRDGSDQNLSWNCGEEGPSSDPAIEAVRLRQIKNFLVVELLAVGVPMLTMGDEVRRTQLGNNNAYCQDNELAWFDWDGPVHHADLHRFTRGLIAGRAQLRGLMDIPSDLSLAQLLERARLEWSGIRLGQPDMSGDSRSLALTVWGAEVAVHVILNAWWGSLEFELPPSTDGLEGWRRVIDTTLESPDDFAGPGAPPVPGSSYEAGPRSMVVLASRLRPESPAGRGAAR